jgi:gamma-glutamyl hydrolase
MYAVRHKTVKMRNSLCIGVITIPHFRKTKHGNTHIMKAYVDWFEDRGVRVIPIPYDTTDYELYFNMINGLFIPGGETPYIMKQKEFITTVTSFFEMSLKKDEYFPIWGTCFGFEMLMFLIGRFNKLAKIPAHGFYPISITSEGKKSRLFSSFSSKYLHYLEANKSTSQNHEYGITTKEFIKNKHLDNFFNILATSLDENGAEYVAAIEAKQYPIYGVCWHPERQNTSGQFVDFFISELRKNRHKCKMFAPFLRNVLKPHKCTQYPEHRGLPCYFF